MKYLKNIKYNNYDKDINTNIFKSNNQFNPTIIISNHLSLFDQLKEKLEKQYDCTTLLTFSINSFNEFIQKIENLKNPKSNNNFNVLGSIFSDYQNELINNLSQYYEITLDIIFNSENTLPTTFDYFEILDMYINSITIQEIINYINECINDLEDEDLED